MSTPLKIARRPIARRRAVNRASAAPSARPRECVIDCGVYVDGARLPFSGDYVEAAKLARRRHGFVWLGVHEPTAEQFAGIAEEFHLHPLAVEDAVSASQRPKLERYDDTLFVALKTLRYVEHERLTATSEIVNTGEVMVFVGADFAITVRHGRHGELGSVRQLLEERPDLLSYGPSAVLYAIADNVVDAYLSVVGDVEVDIDEVESSVFSPSRSQDVERIYQLKRELLELRRAVAPLTAPMRTLAERHLPAVPEDIREYFRDVADHVARVREQVGSFDELLTSILQACLARMTMAENEDMRKISAWVAIAAVPTAVCAVYGMNFKHMPELQWMYGYPIVMGVIGVICLLLYRGFRHNGWL
ncbi:MAG TPA: magnesium and cobalt transport protein CorA [Mycobacteriales bacterium]|nr:magnesium and cobalt transport protein CorA [Mycobacteriales bacterium]